MLAPIRTVWLTAMTLALVLAASPPVQAVQLAVEDGVGDVWSPEGFANYTEEGSVVNTDLVRTVVRHRSREVIVRARITRTCGRGRRMKSCCMSTCARTRWVSSRCSFK
jgi:hypothetical protein